jgi:phosphinothricin acetyltransferase
MMEFDLEPVLAEDGEAIIDIFNHYVENTFAAYPETPVPYPFFGHFLKMAEGYPFLAAKDAADRVLGFGLLRPHNPLPAFARAAEITYFMAPEHTRRGIGGAMLERLLAEAREKGITSILASISSLNSGSIAFHGRHGFAECGRFLGIGRKWGQEFDVVWMQRII